MRRTSVSFFLWTLLLGFFPSFIYAGDPPRPTPCERLGQTFLHVNALHSSFLTAKTVFHQDGSEEKHEQCIYSPNGKYVLIMHTNGEWAVHEAVQPGGEVTTCCDLGRSKQHYPVGTFVFQLNEKGEIIIWKDYVKPENFVYSVTTTYPCSSKSTEFHLDMQDDGNLVLYNAPLGDTSRVAWSTRHGSTCKGSSSTPTTCKQRCAPVGSITVCGCDGSQ